MKLLGKLGKGAYGTVYKAELDGKQVAVKRAFTDSCVSFSGSIRELDIVSKLQGHSSIVNLEGVCCHPPFDKPLSPVQDKGYKEDYLWLVFEKASCDLHSLIYKKGTRTTWKVKKDIARQLIQGLAHIHACGVIHRDIKPSNVLWNGEKATFCDFGLSKVSTKQMMNTPKVSTSWYRSPEMFFFEDYDNKVDVWALACVLVELFASRPLFRGSETELSSRILAWKSLSTHEIREEIKDHLHLGRRDVDEFDKTLGSYSCFLDMLCLMLMGKREERISIGECLTMPYFSSFILQEIEGRSYDRKLTLRDGKERRCALRMVFSLHNLRNSLPLWYKPRILFQSICLFDRYLDHVYKKYPLGIKPDGSIHSEEGVCIRFLCCLYMAAKYFSSLLVLPCFFSFVPCLFRASLSYYAEEELYQILEEFEKYMIFEVCENEMYTATPYEMADLFDKKLTPGEVTSLLHYYANLKGRYYSVEIFTSWLWNQEEI
ncbi:Serine/Threonine protein kinase [Brazilian cedratvirus IHUMI]|uniref:Serine/Threonine protein kinase n=1 Tax=Brazilian cedratvirus IHUMI TaxID=2126980 RepID=A0A2R8FEI0_9VIRU|nr:Serine/Threonine protein kinase [Brazilian cedratvirus IHUMI]